jgi:hypothetical protein
MAPDLPADVPKTDRELLLTIHQDVNHLKEKIEGKDGTGGLCGSIEAQGKRISDLEQSRWYLAGGLGLLILLVGAGRIIELLYVVPHK